MSKYQERRIPKDKEVEQQEQLQEQEEDDKAQLESDIRATRRAVRLARRKVERALSASPFVAADVLAAEDDLDSLKRGLERYEAYLAEEF